jgi:uncharacterized protein YlxP (DUF503 family)
VTVGIARLTLHIAGSRSLKDKRMVVRRVKDLVRDKFNVSIAEVGDNDIWQRAVLGIVLCGNEGRFVESSLDEVLRFVRSKADVTGEEREMQTFDETTLGKDLRHWEG